MRLIRLCLLFCAFSLITGGLWSCSQQRDKTVPVADDDTEMNAAIQKARAGLTEFWKIFENPKEGETDFCLKMKITDGNGTEHFWVTSLKRRGGKIYGIIGNDPSVVRSVKFGQEVEVPEEMISDWLFLRNGKMVGNYTMRAVFKYMPRGEVERLKAKMEDP